MMPLNRTLAAALACAVLVSASPALARPGGWGSDGWGRSSASDWGNSNWNRDRRTNRGRDDREGKVEVATFAAKDLDAAALGKGGVTIEFAPDDGTLYDNAAYEAAVIDQLVGAGYDTTGLPEGAGQIAELRIVRNEIEPAEVKRNPVSGEMEVGVSNRGSMMGLGINLDFTKPKTALVSTRLETRIRDRATGAVLWEGRADIATRAGDGDWSDQAIAVKLARSLFEKFPGTTAADYRL